MDFFKSAEFQSHVEALMEKWHTLGLAIAVVQNDEIASRGYGYASLDPKRPVTGQTIFNTASCSKSLTAASVAILVEDNERYPQVQWGAIVSELLPEDFALSDERYTQSVTVEDILSHRTGLPRHDMSKFGPRAGTPDSTQSITRNIRNLPIVAPIRTRCIYNNLLFTVSAYLVEYSTGLSFADFLRQRILGPLKMTSTFLGSMTAIEAGYEEQTGYPYYWDEATLTYRRIEVQNAPESAGAGVIASCVNDYAKWVKALMHQEHPVTEKIFRDLTTPRSFFYMYEDTAMFNPNTSATLYCLGLKVQFYKGHQVIYHTGGMPGVASRHFFLPEIKFGGAVFGNTPGAHSVIDILMHELVDTALGIPQIERDDWYVLQEGRKREKDEKEEGKKKRREERLLGQQQSSKDPQIAVPLTECIGSYRNAGYGSMKVEMRNGSLFIDATDRTFGFTLNDFEPCGRPGSYIARGRKFLDDGETLEMAVEFSFDKDRVVAVGMEMEAEMKDLVLFEKVSDRP